MAKEGLSGSGRFFCMLSSLAFRLNGLEPMVVGVGVEAFWLAASGMAAVALIRLGAYLCVKQGLHVGQ